MDDFIVKSESTFPIHDFIKNRVLADSRHYSNRDSIEKSGIGNPIDDFCFHHSNRPNKAMRA